MKIGILSVQGAFAEHAAILDELGAGWSEIRAVDDLRRPIDALILPGGESTVMTKLLDELGLFEPLKERIDAGLPVFGTCAGLILLAQRVEGGQVCFGSLDVTVRRNAYGRQLSSFSTEAPFADLGLIPMTFIRAPYISAVGPCAQALATVDGRVVAARQGAVLATAFHPELTDDRSVHRYFLDLVRGRAQSPL